MGTQPTLVRYPWDDWFSRGTFKIRRGVHFHCMVHGMMQQIRNAASFRGLSTRVEVDEDVITVTVRK